jgi:glutaredoxin
MTDAATKFVECVFKTAKTDVVVFVRWGINSSGVLNDTATCGYSYRAIMHLRKMRIPHTVCDLEGLPIEFYEAVKAILRTKYKSGLSTVPQGFLKQTAIGGSDSIIAKYTITTNPTEESKSSIVAQCQIKQ